MFSFAFPLLVIFPVVRIKSLKVFMYLWLYFLSHLHSSRDRFCCNKVSEREFGLQTDFALEDSSSRISLNSHILYFTVSSIHAMNSLSDPFVSHQGFIPLGACGGQVFPLLMVTFTYRLTWNQRLNLTFMWCSFTR